ncbi:prepilin-type N-terminal cleavage/methylation domain-containing protein [Carboxydochorda subterranea]|uniref:Prepilin-type N-terminal cleavage/methylation domain-containing protein n=1 Tax=Carboxydichorda subterranea TaxID=3109565 RepID=A0ABZ1BU85_9FIRM|nr:prepilin-type N-terminal cleavage/methylation domain-containing protein [Limnochorda sp. L945t]WRP16359.1 prepilin-type N-terminal cleavage/methylation domain-containing protein [Limnochorda sp. L945t]
MTGRARKPSGCQEDGVEGFSLIEVLAGIVIVAVALGGLYVLYSTIVRIDAHRRQLTEATATLTSTAEEIKSMPWEQLVRFPGEECPSTIPVPRGLALRCTRQAEPPETDLKTALLVRVTIEVRDQETGRLVADVTLLRAKEGF